MNEPKENLSDAQSERICAVISELDVSHDTIARALGHVGGTVTDIYIAYDYRKVDEANRLVIEHVFGH